MTYTVAIAGRPNVGKSTLFNRLAGKKLALVSDMPGLTRDRREAEIEASGLSLRIVDTAGLEDAGEGTIAARMRAQSERAMRESDVILFLIDARAGVTPADRAFAAEARQTGRPVILVANKAEGKISDAGFYEAYSLGMGEPVAISAEHGEGLADLYARLVETLAPPPQDDEPETDDEKTARDRPVRIAITGRPNAGKSTLVNAILGDERMITGPEPGLTRDAIATRHEWDGRKIELFDTAGLRRKARIEAEPEKLSVGDAINAIRFAEVVVLVLDVQQPFEKQDLLIAELAANEGRALVIAVNKWDLVEDKNAYARALRERAETLLPQVKGVPLVMVSALSGRGVDKLMQAVFGAYEIWNKRVSTGALNRWMAGMLERHAPPAVQGRRIRLRFMTQANARPPTFVAFCSHPDALPESYLRYLVNGLRESFGFDGVPIRFHLRKRDNPYATKGKGRG